MATTEVFYNGDGSDVTFTIPFEYLEESDVKVSVGGTLKTQDTDYTFSTLTEITFTTAPPSGTDNVRIFRDTDIDSLRNEFFAGSAIRAQDLNDDFLQTLYTVQEIDNYTWDNELDTIHSDETWVSSDTQIATTAAMDQRFQDEAAETITSTETWPDNDDTIATTAAIDNRIDTAITNDIAGSDGVTITDDGDGTITVGLGSSSVDFDRIKNDDIITYAEQPTVTPSDANIFTASAAERQFDTLVQTSTPTGSDWEVGKTWLQNDADKTVSIWNGTTWVAIASGGQFTELSKVIYVDSVNGDDTLAGHRISNPKRTIKAAMDDINGDANGDGSIIIVAPGIYGETFPIDIQKNDIGIVGSSLRNCIIHPAIPAADQAGYSVNTPEANELQTMFRVNSGTYLYGLTLQGMKASGTRGGNSLDTDSTYGLPTNQGWNFAFYPGATIKKSPYIQNCTNFSDSQINNVNFTPHTPGEGAAGDLDSGPSGGGILIDGSVPAAASPLRSMVCDSYTHTALDGPGIFITNNGYCQATSSYSFFNHFHLKTKNGGQANLAASTTDFGSHSLIADGRSPYAIFTATTTASASDGSTTFTIGAPTARTATPLPWHGSSTRPQDNMLVDIGGNTYPVLSAVAAGSGWTVTVSRPNPTNLTENLGLNGAVSSGASVSFFLRSMIASSGHTMEYVGSGTDYRALPENGGVPDDTKQLTELNNGKIWAAVTDHRGKFSVGSTFSVDQQTGVVTIAGEASDTVRKSAPTGSAILPVGTTAQRDASPNNGFLRYNSTTNDFEGYQNGAWDSIGAKVINDLDDAVTNGSNFTVGLGTGALANDDGSNNANTAVGYQSLNANTSGASNTAVGFQSLLDNTTGGDNSAFGTGTLYENTTGQQNVAVGDGALNKNTTGSNNTALGVGSLGANTTASNNVAVGHTALDANTTGTENVAVGTLAGNKNTTGDFNVAVGYRALTDNTTANNNVAVGHYALDKTTGGSNTAVGGRAMDVSTSANLNSAFGYGALGLNTTGDQNVAIGALALAANTTSGDNTAVGYQAGDSVTTGRNLTIIGYDADASSATATNEITLGNASVTSLRIPGLQSGATDGQVLTYSSSNGNITLADAGGGLSNNSSQTNSLGVGSGALSSDSGNNNTAFGSAALDASVSGVQNTAAGALALTNCTTGGYNTAVGNQAGLSVTTGGQNTSLGAYAGYSTTTASNTTNIGYGAAYNNTGASNTAIGAFTMFGNAGSSTGGNNTAVGYEALKETTSGTHNTAIGVEALKENTTGYDNVACGNALNKNTTGGLNTAVGRSALYFNTTASHNTAVGNAAMQTNTTGARNTVVGHEALFSNTTANDNVAIGRQALYSNTTATNNTAVGYKGLYANTTGAQNTAVGKHSLLNNTTANGNTALGWETLRTNTTGAYNTAIGGVSLYNSTTASNNVAIGYDSMYTNTTGANNVAVGVETLEKNTTGSSNVAVGYQALEENTTGASNTAVGFKSGDAITTGGTNTLLGGVAGGSITTGNSNVAVGHEALRYATTPNSNIAIGKEALGAVTTGAQNIAIGTNAGDALQTGEFTACLGNYSLTAATGSQNTALGYSSGSTITSGGNNIVIGYDAQASAATVSNEITLGNSSITSLRIPGLQSGASDGQVLTYSSSNGNITLADAGGGLSNNSSISTSLGIGTNALDSETTGYQNTALGYNAGTAATTAHSCTLIGYQCGDTLTSGQQNTGVGREAFDSLSTGSHNTAVGVKAGSSITGGSYNVAVGRNAGKSHANTDNNTSVGGNAAEFMNASGNTAVGFQALRGSSGSSSGGDNTGLGLYAATSITTGTDNTAAGSSCLESCTTGIRNVALGRKAGTNITTGSNNTVIGFLAGNITTGSNNTCIGNDADPSSSTVSNEVVLGNSSVATLRCNTQTISSLSDGRDKTEVEDLPLGLDFIDTLRPVKFKWETRDGNGKDGSYEAGFIAQDLQSAQSTSDAEYLNMVMDSNPDRLEARYGQLIPVLVQAIKDLKSEIQTLKSNV